MAAVTKFGLSTNRITGKLPDEGLGVMRALTLFRLRRNRFTGQLPERGLQKMRAVLFFFTRRKHLDWNASRQPRSDEWSESVRECQQQLQWKPAN
eukprot:3288606-Amphidinium_carterae.1